MTAASATPGWDASSASSSAGATWYALTLISSFSRPGDEHVAEGVDAGEIAGAQPAVRVKVRSRCRGLAEVAQHHLRAAYPQLARSARGSVAAGGGVDQAHLRAREDLARGAGRAAGPGRHRDRRVASLPNICGRHDGRAD
jgi:hypothetical protein